MSEENGIEGVLGFAMMMAAMEEDAEEQVEALLPIFLYKMTDGVEVAMDAAKSAVSAVNHIGADEDLDCTCPDDLRASIYKTFAPSFEATFGQPLSKYWLEDGGFQMWDFLADQAGVSVEEVKAEGSEVDTTAFAVQALRDKNPGAVLLFLSVLI